MLVDGVLLCHLDEIGDGIPPGLELDIDLGKSILSLLVKGDKGALSGEEIEKNSDGDRNDNNQSGHNDSGLALIRQPRQAHDCQK